MAIGTAVKRGGSVHVFDENGRLLFVRSAGYKPGDGLKGYTSSTVTIRRGDQLYVFDERGRLLYTRAA